MLAPYLVKSVIHVDTFDPLSFIPIMLRDVAKFDNENAKCNEEYQRALDHAGALANFLWLIDIGKAPLINFVNQPDDDELQNMLPTGLNSALKSQLVMTLSILVIIST